jgi:O-acetyl-ADP-ribose deacetylase (regulator of RNase III)
MKCINADILTAPCGIVVQGCNAQGVMGSGLARSIREVCPQAYEDYKKAYDTDGLKVGQVVWTAPTPNTPFWIANGITQEFYGRNPKIVYVDYNGLKEVFRQVKAKALELDAPVHYPKIGAGLANGNWSVIEKIIEEQLLGCDHCLWDFPVVPAPPRKKWP